MYDSFCDWKINNQFEDDLAVRIRTAGLVLSMRGVNLDGGCVSGPAMASPRRGVGEDGRMIYALLLRHVVSCGGWAFTKTDSRSLSDWLW